MKTNFLMLWKRVFCFENRLSGVKKTNSLLFKEKYSKESNRVKQNWGNAIYIVVVVVLIFTLSFLIILSFILFYFI